ncbi:lipoyl(octanoyl) transferase LipB [Planktomarina temperata]|nr:lipoyl(octanoyl) transferase LipB [Planktomarina temperata]
MTALLDTVDPDGLLEYSVVFTDRSLNHMSAKFQGVMRDISSILKEVYSADGVAVIPGGGTYGMEAVARQIAVGKNVMVLRNGWFSYRWTQIFEAGSIPASETVMKARRVGNGAQAAFAPAPIDEVVAKILSDQPDVVFAPHVETSAGLILPDDYLKAVSDAVHSYGGLFVLDCIASGCAWVDMRAVGVDFLIYVLLDVGKRGRDVRKFVQQLEDWVIRTLAEFNVTGEIRPGRVGVWVTRPDKPLRPSGALAEDKIAAIGIRLRKWISFHGISINVEPDLEHFSGIVPCGIAEHGVTSLVDLGLPVTLADVDLALRRSFDAVFSEQAAT